MGASVHIFIHWLGETLGLCGEGASNATSKNTFSSTLSGRGQAFYDALVDNLFEECAKAVESQNASDTLQLVIRHSHSWRVLDWLLIEVPTANTTVECCVHEWRKIIWDLRGLQSQVHGLQKCIDNHQSTDSKPIDRYIDDRERAKQEIQARVDNARSILDKRLNNPMISNQPQMAKFLNYLDKEWSHLTVFSDWSEVPMDAHELFVRVYQQANQTFQKCDMDNDKSISAIITFKADDLQSKNGISANPSAVFTICDSEYQACHADSYVINKYFNGLDKTKRYKLKAVLDYLAHDALNEVNKKLMEE